MIIFIIISNESILLISTENLCYCLFLLIIYLEVVFFFNCSNFLNNVFFFISYIGFFLLIDFKKNIIKKLRSIVLILNIKKVV